ncbi:MAG: hypothetical protein LBR10_08800 [Prevotellaceae bacterium]|jgi:hypothetical protein|nr:hypothetical protein [Prevotellaceae bacterium]
MDKKHILLIILIHLSAITAFSQERGFELSGYVGGMPSLILRQPGETWWQALIHNRLNVGWQMSNHLRMDAGMRNRVMTGSEAMLDPQSTDFDAGWADLSWNWAEGKKVLANTAFDRLYLTFERAKWKLQLGRQRINWGQTFVWNPNDIFNTHSFFDFDYPERAGCDAFRGAYFHNETAYSELATSVNRTGEISAALLHHWNLRNFDYQIIVGEQTGSDAVLGGAWTGDFKGLNFRGEFSYFRPIKNFADTSGIFAVSVGADYMFSNSLMLQAEILYNNARNSSSDGLLGLYSAPLSAKRLSVCDWSMFAQASYPVTPRLNASVSGMYFADIKSYYAGLSSDYSVIENLDISLVAQFFSTPGNAASGGMKFILGFARLKYSF